MKVIQSMLSKFGSEPRIRQKPVSCGFLKSCEFYLRCGEALSFQQQIAQISVPTPASE